ncbi:mitogen-activated protein kinase kinase kinase 4 [Cydia strobilella]|uniref:mitogen-activated protein kinase kinase kinase 4 n=1 Tax=Cydia strobilella TaxID=1100964 RepID=UPI00300482C9
MDVSLDKDWKKKLGFQINFKSDSEEDPDGADVVMRRPPPSRRSTEFLLDDVGDGAEADLLSSTPPRALIRKKEKARRCCVFGRENIDEARFQKMMRDRRNTTVYVSSNDSPVIPERLKKRWSLKRSTDRDWKIEMGQRGETKADSLPLTETPAIPTLVESCSRFMSLTSRLKCRASHAERDSEREAPQEQLPESRVNFHRTFSMLINMGNVDKGCRRTISREEQVWQNELKDLIWLELQAKIAGRTLAQQDHFLCSQRNVIPTLIKNIIDYKFVNPNPCKGRSKRLCAANGSREDLTNEDAEDETEEDKLGCLSFDCRLCSSAIGAAMTEVRTLLESFHRAGALYPSTQAMTADHKLLATSLFQNRIKALCLWYNMAMHMRLKILSVRRLLATVGAKGRPTMPEDYPCVEPSIDGVRRDRDAEQCSQRQVRFNCDNPTSSTNSVESCPTENQSEAEKEPHVESKSGAEEPGVAQSDGEKNKDETDCVIRTDETGQTTPEIIISDAKYSTNDTSTSSESGYMSEREKWFNCSSSESVFNVGSLADLTRLRLLEKCEVSPYREYHYEILKIQGVRRSMMFIHKLRTKLLNKVYLTFLLPESTLDESSREEDPTDASDEKDDKTQRSREGEDEHELRRFGCWSEETLSMGLPSYRNHFLLLSSICMEAVHDYLTLRLEGRPEHPSCLTIKQLIHELKEGLDIATTMRQAFVGNIAVALRGCRAGHAARQDLLLIIKTFDASVEDVFKQYLSYLSAMSEVEHMPRSCLEAEWSFVARVAERGSWVKDLAPVAFTDIACNQLNRVMKQFEAKLILVNKVDKNSTDPNRYVFYTLCREAQSVFASEREAALQAAAFARALASHLARAGAGARRARRTIYESLFQLRECIVRHTMVILERASKSPPEEFLHEVTDGVVARVRDLLLQIYRLGFEYLIERARENPPEEFLHEVTDGVVARVRDLLLQIYRLGFEFHRECYKFVHGDKPAPRRQRPASLQPPRARHERVRPRRPETMLVHDSVNPMPPRMTFIQPRRPETMLVHESVNPMIHKELHRFVNERFGPTCRRPRAPRWLLRSESVTEDEPDGTFAEIDYPEIKTQVSIEELLGSPPPPPQARVEQETHTDEEAWSAAVARAIVCFARCWMRFVLERCERGRGRRPRWASQGLEFLMLACDPYNTRHLTDEEFEELKHLMDGCISHVIGSRCTTKGSDSEPSPRPRHRLHSPLPSQSGAPKESLTPSTPPGEPEAAPNFNAPDPHARKRSVMEAIKKLDMSRDAALRSMKAVGRVAEPAVTHDYEPRVRQVTFKWQRGLKIGAGTFGKVYTVVNTETGQLLAMKEVSIAAGDRRAMQRAANELRVLEGAQHPHLVRYYGIEVHREEMLIFMELCVEGSLETLIATSGALPEQTVRRYTAQLLSAVSELHARNIAHRDIKSGNIFLMNEGHCLKLGDFGCAVKIRATATAAGELQGYVGTQAYMAPEVFMKSDGHGRATDIWSLGCVTTEMASGKRPFPEYDSNYQIMFVVGMGGRPHIPETLSEEGQQFCLLCLTHDPDKRPKAEALKLHHFLMVKNDECFECKPGKFL